MDSYIYEDTDGEQYAIRRDTLIFNFHVHGYLRCPLKKRPMTTEEIISLLKISDRHDIEMSRIVRRYYSNFCDYQTRKQQLQITEAEYAEMKIAFIYLLTIGLLLIGWHDTNDTIPTFVEKNLDIVHVHLNCLPYLRALRSLSCYGKIQRVGVYGNFCNSGYTIANVFQELENPDLCDLSRHGKEIIATAAYYLRSYFSYQKPEINYLISTF